MRAHAARQTARSIELALRAADADTDYAEAMEHAGMLLVTRLRHYIEGLSHLERAVDVRPADAGLWYALGWCREFAAHEIRRHPAGGERLSPRTLYEGAAEAFRRCLALSPGGKLQGDAEDLLDHVENELAGM